MVKKAINYCALVVLALIIPLSVQAQTIVNLSPRETTVGADQEFALDMSVMNVTDLYGAAFNLDFDPSLITFVSASNGGFLNNGAITPDIMTAVTTPGKLIFGVAKVNTIIGSNGSGSIAKLTFRSLTKEGVSALNFSRNSLKDSNLTVINTVWTGASASVSVPDLTPPTVPTNLTAALVNEGQVALNWTGSSDLRSPVTYRIYRGGQFIAEAANVSYQESGLAAGTAYSYQVAATDAAGNESARSNPAIVVIPMPVDTTPPSVPNDLVVATSTVNSVELKWTASIDSVGVVGYRVYRNSALYESVTENGFKDMNVTAGSSYSYQVAGYDAAGNLSALSEAITASTPQVADTDAPSVPANVRLSAMTVSQINLVWDGSIDNRAGAVNYKIYQNGSYAANSNLAVYQASGLTASTAYSFEVSAVDMAGNESAKSTVLNATTLSPIVIDTAAPTVPGSLTASLSAPASVSLKWNASVDSVSAVSYKIYRNNAYLNKSNTAYFIDANTKPGATYVYQVSATDLVGNESARSNSVQITVGGADRRKPSTPGSLKKVRTTSATMAISWSASTDIADAYNFASGVRGYKIFRNGRQVAETAITVYEDSGLTAQTAYTYSVAAVDFADNQSYNSFGLYTVTAQVPDTVAPTQPANLKAYNNQYYSPRDVRLIWSASRDNRYGYIKYLVYRNEVLIGTTYSTSYYNKLSETGSYSYQVRAMDASSNESIPSVAVVVNFEADTVAPGVPANFRGVQSYYNKGYVNFYWSASKDNRYGGVKYNFYRDGIKQFTVAYPSAYNRLPAPGEYRFEVTAVDIAGNESAKSLPVTIRY